MAINSDRWEEHASEYISVRNHLVREYRYPLDSLPWRITRSGHLTRCLARRARGHE